MLIYIDLASVHWHSVRIEKRCFWFLSIHKVPAFFLDILQNVKALVIE